MLGILIENNDGALVKGCIKGYVRISCCQISEPRRHYPYSLQTTKNKGPMRLLTIITPLVSLCEQNGWDEYENILVEATTKLCLYGNVDHAIGLVEKLSPSAPTVEAT